MEIKCNFQSKNKSWDHLGSLYTCKITSASITRPNQEIKAFIGVHKAGKIDLDVEAIRFVDTRVHYMPRGIGAIFPNLKVVQINNCGLKEITREDLIGLENISVLYLDYNELNSLPDNLFEGFKNLKEIDFEGNKLKLVNSQLLQPILGNHLTLVSFRKNPIIKVAFDATKVNTTGRYTDLPGLMRLMDEKSKTLPKIEKQFEPSTSRQSFQTSNLNQINSAKLLETFNSHFMNGFKNLWSSGQFSDFTIIVSHRKFRVHKCVLAMQSECFAEAFKKSGTNSSELKIDSLSAETVEQVLRWMYTGQIPDVKNAIEVFAFTMELKIYLLKDIAENLVLQKIDQINAMEIFKLAHRYKSENLKKTAFDQIKMFIANPDLDNALLEEPEELEKIFDVKTNYDELMNKRRKLNYYENPYKKS